MNVKNTKTPQNQNQFYWPSLNTYKEFDSGFACNMGSSLHFLYMFYGRNNVQAGVVGGGETVRAVNLNRERRKHRKINIPRKVIYIFKIAQIYKIHFDLLNFKICS